MKPMQDVFGNPVISWMIELSVKVLSNANGMQRTPLLFHFPQQDCQLRLRGVQEATLQE